MNASRRVVIIDYGSGNLRSAARAFERVALDNTSIQVTAEAAALAQATHIVLPGVGAFADCMRGLSAVPGLRDALEQEVRVHKKPFLGICVGMQLLFDTGYEHGTHAGLGWIQGEVVRIAAHTNSLQPATCNLQLKIPHMGWNELHLLAPAHPLVQGIEQHSHAYFVHSYHARCAHPVNVIATTDYGAPLTAIVAKDNIMGTQFHPEKSQETGLRLIGNFLHL